MIFDVERPMEIHQLSTVFLHDDVTRSSPVVKIHGVVDGTSCDAALIPVDTWRYFWSFSSTSGGF